MNRITQYLKQPYEGEHRPLFNTILVVLIVSFILIVFQPFGIFKLTGWEFAVTVGVSMVGTGIGMLISSYLLPKVLKKFYPNSTIGTYILDTLLTIFIVAICHASVSTIYSLLRWEATTQELINNFLFFFVVTILPSPIILIILAILFRNRMLTSNLQEAQKLNSLLLAKNQQDNNSKSNETVTLSGITKESIELNLEDLLFLEAFGNYVKVNYLHENKLKQKLLRTTIKQMEDVLQKYPSIIRCHRAFLVNTSKISAVKGNSQGYKLAFLYIEEEVPVSRAYAKALKEQLD